MNVPLEDLYGRVCAGDVRALDDLCRQLEGPMFGYALSICGNRHTAEDLVQECLLRLVRLLREGKLRARSGTVRSLVFTMLHNLAIDWRRTSKHLVPLDAALADRHRPADEQAMIRDEVQFALAQLPENHRAALSLRELGELSYGEIAEALGVTLPEVKIWIFRARKQMATLLRPTAVPMEIPANDL